MYKEQSFINSTENKIQKKSFFIFILYIFLKLNQIVILIWHYEISIVTDNKILTSGCKSEKKFKAKTGLIFFFPSRKVHKKIFLSPKKCFFLFYYFVVFASDETKKNFFSWENRKSRENSCFDFESKEIFCIQFLVEISMNILCRFGRVFCPSPNLME